KVAKAKGRLRGKQPKLNHRQEAHLVSLVHSGEYSTAEVAELFGIGRSTVYRAIERLRLEARAGLAAAASRRSTPSTAPAAPYPTPFWDAGASASAASSRRTTTGSDYGTLGVTRGEAQRR